MKTRLSRHKSSLDKLFDNLLFCPLCSTWRTTLSKLSTSSPSRRASTLSSNTAINATQTVPAKYQDLHSALASVRRTASPFVSLSRLQLAQQGLQSTSPKIRIAVLGLNAQNTARRLVRLLLADALEDEAAWEKELVKTDNGQGVLVTYGEPSNSSLPPSRTTVPTIHVPSSLLERNNTEILISAVNPPQTGNGRHAIPSGTLLAPTVGTPTAASGRQTNISQPVHASLVIPKDLDEFVSLAELLSAVEFSSKDEAQCVYVALNLKDSNLKTAGSPLVLDLSKAENGLSAIRRSIGETPTYAQEWKDSGMLQASQWFTELSSSPATDQLSEPVRRLVSSVIAAAATSIETQMTSQLAAQTSALSLAARTNLEAAIEEFSRNAHQELQSGLASAWRSRNWRKLAWYKLFWRVDDVGLIITDLISSAWLPRTERAVYELSGRLAQVGISPMDASPAPMRPKLQPAEQKPATSQPIATMQAQFATASDAPVEPVITNASGTATLTMSPIPVPQPLSATISSMRSATINRAINELTSTAQQLVLRTLSISGLSAGLSGLTYASFANSMYEAGTIVALGTAFALYRMQGGWMRATKGLEEGLFDEGRTVIQRVVSRMRQLMEHAGETRADGVDMRKLKEAKESVERAKVELGKLAQPEGKEQGRE